MREATTAGDQPAAARIRVALGLVAATAGRHDEAVQLLEDALASPCPPRPATHPEAFSTLGQSYAVLGRVDQAVELFERCLEETREQDEVVALRFRLYLSCALGDIGEFGRAEEVVSEALDHGERFADPITYVHLNWSVARLAALQGNHAVALEHVRRAIALLEATEDTLQLGRAHLLCGFIMNMQRDGARAESHLAEAKRLLEQRGDAQDLVSLKTEQAKAAAQLGRADEAIGLAQEVLDRLGKDDPAEQGGAWSALAQGYAAKGEIDSAEESFRRALGLLGKHTRWREAEQAALRWAELLEGHDRPREAAELRARANEFGSRATSTVTAPAGR
jgi:tetratricopeptide (TPR) repeat protein